MVGSAYYLRPATTQGRGRLRDGSWGGPCNFLTAAGCAIFDHRPSGCRGLEPLPLPERIANEGCVVRYGSKQDACVAWMPYRDLIDMVLDELDP